MADHDTPKPDEPRIPDLSPDLDATQNNEKLETIIEKEEKSTRTPTGLWHWIIATLGAVMVLFYFYTAGVASVATQYHRGVYVFITYVLVFLLYPVGKTWVRLPLNLFVGAVVSSAVAAWLSSGRASP
jgi:TRAP-type uncharacterized transport system fused permease subunit